ncbi:hypothetical protein [Halomonas chromatireducens]|uniref:hypothetical protein n=1 Tax=Halomonas chromatireducens TaxID=507626 RepID=UPI000B12E930|nr:hypothetical protein [Halomonas chromatireducens]
MKPSLTPTPEVTRFFTSQRIDELFNEAATAFPDEEREALYMEAQEILHEDVPVGWLMELGFPTCTCRRAP